MSAYDEFLEPSSTGSPDCSCGKPMKFERIEVGPHHDGAHVKVFTCPACLHELRLMVWDDAGAPQETDVIE